MMCKIKFEYRKVVLFSFVLNKVLIQNGCSYLCPLICHFQSIFLGMKYYIFMGQFLPEKRLPQFWL